MSPDPIHVAGVGMTAWGKEGGNFAQYGVDAETALIDYEAMKRLVEEHQPKLIIGGFSAYSREVDWARMRAMARRLIDDGVFGGRMEDRAHSLEVFRAHEAEVKSAIAPGRLLVFEASQGWEPLCDFLGAPVPAEPYPHANSTEAFHERSGGPD